MNKSSRCLTSHARMHAPYGLNVSSGVSVVFLVYEFCVGHEHQNLLTAVVFGPVHLLQSKVLLSSSWQSHTHTPEKPQHHHVRENIVTVNVLRSGGLGCTCISSRLGFLLRKGGAGLSFVTKNSSMICNVSRTTDQLCPFTTKSIP